MVSPYAHSGLSAQQRIEIAAQLIREGLETVQAGEASTAASAEADSE